MKRIGVMTSGGDAPGMNAAIRAVVREAISLDMEVFGIMRGFEGLLDGDIKKLEWTSVGDILQRGGTILRTARSKRFLDPANQEKAAEVLRTFEIEGLVIIGGDGSLHGGLKLSKLGIPVMGLPGTIDNDLAYTDYTIGFDTAVNTILGLISNIRDTSSAHERTTVIEVMGRRCGDIALYAGLAGGADVIMVPEVPADIHKIVRNVLRGQSSGKLHSIIMRAEGSEIGTNELVKTLEEMTNREVKAVVPGYIQRGGSPTSNDRILASLTGAKAVQLLYDDEESKAIGICQGEIVAYDLEEALNMKAEFNQQMYELSEILT